MDIYLKSSSVSFTKLTFLSDNLGKPASSSSIFLSLSISFLFCFSKRFPANVGYHLTPEKLISRVVDLANAAIL